MRKKIFKRLRHVFFTERMKGIWNKLLEQMIDAGMIAMFQLDLGRYLARK